MIGLKIYPEFMLQAGALAKDGELLDVFKYVKDCTSAQYINFSVMDYNENSCEMKHFLTYPMSWISHYLKNSFQDIDPLLSADYRRVAYLDWSELWRSKDEFKFFSASLEHGIGDNGLSFVVHLGENIFGVSSFVFDKKFDNWAVFRDKNLGLMRQQSEFLAEHYKRLFTQLPLTRIKLTKRELECLHHVAAGETDSRIARLMGIGHWTVNGHIKCAKSKLGVSNRSAAVAKALTLGLLNLKSEFEN